MLHAFSRTEMMIGAEALLKLKNARVAVFGIGGVGSYAVEGLARAGVGRLVLIDDDRICLTNLNRQLHATRKTVGQYKVDAMRQRVLEINPDAQVETLRAFYLPANAADLFCPQWDYIIDAMDTVSAKLDLVVRAQESGVPLICCLGTANKMDPTRFEVVDLARTDVCPLAKIMRKELRKRGVKNQKVVYSRECPVTPLELEDASCSTSCVCPVGTTRTCTTRRQIPASVSFVPSVAGLIAAGEVIKHLIGWGRDAEGTPDAGGGSVE
jgi:tRNA A37 threonylcarbamoyladenosine dehydratase